MLKNIGTVDRIIRVILGVVLVVVGLNMESGWKWLVMLIALVPLGTAAVSYCPVERSLGLSTLGNKLSWGKKA
jgi:hypothetical protein